MKIPVVLSNRVEVEDLPVTTEMIEAGNAAAMDGKNLGIMDGVREYGDGDPVELWRDKHGRLVVLCSNEAGCAGTAVDLVDLIQWAKKAAGQFPEVKQALTV